MIEVAYQYAEALYSLSKDSNTEAIFVEFDRFIKLYESDLKKLLTHPKLLKQEKKDIIKRLELEQLFQDFLFVLIDKNRISMIHEIKQQYQGLLDHQKDILRVTVASSKILSKDQLKQIEAALKKRLNRQIIIENVLDKTIVGGIKIMYEGMVLDNTINYFIKSLTESVMA